MTFYFTFEIASFSRCWWLSAVKGRFLTKKGPNYSFYPEFIEGSAKLTDIADVSAWLDMKKTNSIYYDATEPEPALTTD